MTPLWILSGIAFAIAGLSIGFHYKVAALWSTFLGVVLAFAAITVWIQTVIETEANVQKERPYIIFRATRLKPLTAGNYPIIEYELENISKVEVSVLLTDATCQFTPDLKKSSFESLPGNEGEFAMAPTKKIYGQIRLVVH
jgi:hypothetical protein